MKKTTLITLIFLAACHVDKDLSQEGAYNIINSEYHYPLQITHTMKTSDPVNADIARSSGLIEEGYISVISLGSVIPKGRDMIEVTDKGKVYLTEYDSIKHTITIKIANAQIQNPKSITIEKGANNLTAIATYPIEYSNLTPFVKLLYPRDFNKSETRKTLFIKDANGNWTIEKTNRE